MLLGASPAAADGCFVFRWNKPKDINEPTQKAIIFQDDGQEDMVLQVKYEGPAEDFGWLIPVPGLPEVQKGSMACFYEMSRLTQRRFDAGTTRGRGTLGMAAATGVKVIEVKTLGAYEVAVLAATDTVRLGEWLEAHHFVFPKEKKDVLDGYVKKQWYFVAAKINPNQNGFILRRGHWRKEPETAISPITRQQLANGELHPLIISFPSETAVFPLAISAVNGKPSEISLYILASEPLISRVIFDKKFADYKRERGDWIQQAAQRHHRLEENQKRVDAKIQNMTEESQRRPRPPSEPGARFAPMWDDDPTDPRPSAAVMRQLMGREARRFRSESAEDFSGGGDLVQSMQVDPQELTACSKEMPRLAGKSWWLTKQVEVFAPENMRDLEFEPAVPVLAAKLGTDGGEGPALCLAHLGAYAVPSVLSALNSSNALERRQAAYAVGGYVSPTGPMKDDRLTAVVPGLLRDADARNRRDGCYAARMNWEAAFAPQLEELLVDSDEDVRSAANECLSEHREDLQLPILRKLIAEDGPAASKAAYLVGDGFPRDQLAQLFTSTNLPVVSFAFEQLTHRSPHPNLNELEPLLTNSLIMARLRGLKALVQMGDKDAVDRIVAMLRDPDEGVRWLVRARLRRLTGLKLGPDPAAWEKWWAENKEDFAPR